MGIFRRKKKDREQEHEHEPGFDVEVEARERFSHPAGSSLSEVVGTQSAKYDPDNPPPAPRGRASRLHPDEKLDESEFWK